MFLDDIQFTQTNLLNALTILVADTEDLDSKFLASITQINDITLDSRNVNPKRAFVAIKGSVADGHSYIESAINKGCRLLLCERELGAGVRILATEKQCTVIVYPKLRDGLSILLKTLFDTDKIDISAITGTNGKTSVASLNAQLSLAQYNSSACLGTLGLSIYQKEYDYRKEHEEVREKILSVGANTTPDIITHYKILKYLRQEGIDDYSLEASSHGIEQGRLAGLPIDIVAFTNLSQDHLDYHGDMASYGQAKRGLLDFDSVKHIVLNADDEESLLWFKQKASQTTVVWYGLNEKSVPEKARHYCIATQLVYTPFGIEFELRSSWGEASIALPLFGQFNVSNALAALCIRLLKGESFEKLVNRVQKIKGVAGRMELFTHDSPFGNLIVDYAHTPDALNQALKAAKQHTNGKLFCVFGCGGNRDKGKRALMGNAAAKHSDVVILTQDNSRDEAPEDIINDIQSGMSESTVTHTELDRQRAIRWAFEQSNKADLILLAGKGHEDYVEIRGKRISYDERAFVRTLISEVAA